MRTPDGSILIVAILATLGSVEARAQTHVSCALGTGSLFAGVGFGVGGGPYDTGSAFTGVAFRTSHPWCVEGSEPYSRHSCWDAYWDSYHHPYSGWYEGCVMAGPYRAARWRARWGGGYFGTRYVYGYISDPFIPIWGPYWAYDPWGTPDWYGYSDGYYDGWYWGNGYYYRGYGRVRTVYASVGRAAASVYRPSPLARTGAVYKESPRGAVRRATPRRSSAISEAPRTAATAARLTRPVGTTSVDRRAVDVAPRTRRKPIMHRTPTSVSRTIRSGTPRSPAAALPRRMPRSSVKASGAPSTRGTPNRGTAGSGNTSGRSGGTPGATTSRPLRTRVRGRSSDITPPVSHTSTFPPRERTQRFASPVASGLNPRRGSAADPSRYPSARRAMKARAAPRRAAPAARAGGRRAPATRSAPHPQRRTTASAPPTRSSRPRASGTRRPPRRPGG